MIKFLGKFDQIIIYGQEDIGIRCSTRAKTYIKTHSFDNIIVYELHALDTQVYK